MKKDKSGVNALFISDWHLFHPYSRVKKQDILLSHACIHGPPEALYMVGDIVDLEFLLHRLDKMIEKGVCARAQARNFEDFLALMPRKERERDFDPHAHYRILDRVLTLARGGTAVTWALGNHDEKLEGLVGRRIDDIHIVSEAVFETRHGKKHPSVSRYLVKHGHTFDPAHLRRNTDWYRKGSALLDWIIERDLDMQKKLPSWEFYFASFGKKAFKRLVGNFREAAIKDAVANEMDGVICGHIHVSDYRLDTRTGKVYMNCGDAFTHGTALSYGRDGSWQLLDVKDIKTQFNYAATLSPEHSVHPQTMRFMDILWRAALDRHYGQEPEQSREGVPHLALVA